jgi:hypothetical protein
MRQTASVGLTEEISTAGRKGLAPGWIILGKSLWFGGPKPGTTSRKTGFGPPCYLFPTKGKRAVIRMRSGCVSWLLYRLPSRRQA